MTPAGQDIVWSGGPSLSCDAPSCGSTTQFGFNKQCNYVIYMYCVFMAAKIDNFQMLNCDIFLVSAQNIDCGYYLESPQLHCGTHNPRLRAEMRKVLYIPVHPNFNTYKSEVHRALNYMGVLAKLDIFKIDRKNIQVFKFTQIMLYSF